MKKLFISASLLLAIVSCSTDETIEQQDKLQEVTFNVSALNVSVEPISRATVLAKNVLTNIHYFVKNKATGKYSIGTQTVTTAGNDFGTIKMWLSKGEYETTFFGYGNTNVDGDASMFYDQSYHALWLYLNNKDAFINKNEVSINNETSNVESELTRLNGALVIRLNDNIPADIGKVKVSFAYFPKWSVDDERATYEGNDGLATKHTDYLTISNSRVEEYTYYMLPQTNVTVNLTIYDTSGGELGTTSVITSFFKNKRTIIEGNLLDVINQTPFSITVTDDWEEDVIVPLQ